MQETLSSKSEFMEIFDDQYGFVDELIKAGDFSHSFFAPVWGFEMAGSIIDLGNLILSKYPLSDEQSFHTYNQYYIRKTSGDAQSNTVPARLK